MSEKTVSSKARLLAQLREKNGAPLSGGILAKELGISRVAVWKTVQALVEAGYSIETGETGYLLDPKNEKDFLYPWEFGEKEAFFSHFLNTGSTMDRARESALRGAEGGIFTAEKQTSGRGRNGRTWVSRQGGLFFSILDRPHRKGLCVSIADYILISLVMQIAVVKCISKICGKQAFLRWPNDIYINNRKISGVTTEIMGEGDILKWVISGIGVNVNNKAPFSKAVTLSEISGRQISRREVMCNILDEIEITKNTFSTAAAYSQGNRALAQEWNSLTDCIGAKAVIFEPEKNTEASVDMTGKILARGVFSGIDPSGRCILKTGTEKGDLYFNHGSVSFAVLNT